MTRAHKQILCVFCVFLFLQGCSNFFKTTGLSTYYTDSNIKFTLIQRLKRLPNLYDKNHIVPTVYQGTVLLAGQVLHPEERIEVERLTKGIPGIKRVYNELEIAGPTSTLTRSSDSWITTRIKTNMLLDKHLSSHEIKIVTENGIVYLLGTVSQQQAQIATTVARQVPGVQKVVPLFVVHSN